MLKKWSHLIGYCMLVFSSQLLWVTFSPITSDVAILMNTSVGNIGTLAALFPIIYIFVAFPAGRWLDTHFKLALGFGAITVGLGAIARLFLPFHYMGQLYFNVVITICHTLYLNTLSYDSCLYFTYHINLIY